MELLRNARDAGARNIYVASVLRRRRYRTLTVLDDGQGVDERYATLIFEPGVTTRHLNPTIEAVDPNSPPHGAGLSLYHIRNLAVRSSLLSAASPTSITVTFDTRVLPERSLQSTTRPSRSNLRATVENFARTSRTSAFYYAQPAKILASLIKNHIIHNDESAVELVELAEALGLWISTRTAQKIKNGEIPAIERIDGSGDGVRRRVMTERGGEVDGSTALLDLGDEQMSRIAAILREAAHASYVEVHDLRQSSRPGEITLTARVREPEDEYE